jgi:CRISPR-associated protein Csb1
MARALSGFIEATGVRPADSGGTKVDHILPSPKALGLSADEGYGNVPYPRTEFTAEEIKAYLNLDLALLRGYRFPDDATKLLIALALFKIRRFLSTGLRLRTACDLEVDGDVTVTRPSGFVVPDEKTLLQECERLIKACNNQKLFAGVTGLKWAPAKKASKKKAEAAEDQAGADAEDEDT